LAGANQKGATNMKLRMLCPLAGALLMGCGQIEDGVSSQRSAVADPGAAWTVFANPYGDGRPNPTEGISGFVSHNTSDGSTHVALHVRGLPAGREFGSHVHALPCDVNAAGGHYRNDPAGPATSTNEIWLDFTASDAGNGNSQAVAAFLIRPNGAHAVAIHDHGTDPATGAAGPKLACVNVNFDE